MRTIRLSCDQRIVSSEKGAIMPDLLASLHALKIWTLLAGVCAVVAAIGAAFLLAWARRRSRAWWMGVAACILSACGLALAERCYGAYQDLQPVASCCVSGCKQWYPWIGQAIDRAQVLGLALIIAIATALALGAVSVLRDRTRQAEPILPVLRRMARVFIGVLLLDGGAFWLVQGIAHWLQYAYLADISNAGDGLGQIPLYQAILETFWGTAVTIGGIALLAVIAGATWRRSQAAAR